MDLFEILSAVGLLGAGLGLAAYAYGYILRRAAFRWPAILSLFSTIIALAQFSHVMTVGAPPGGSREMALAMIFLLIAGLSQALMAVRGRRTADGRATDFDGGATEVPQA
jgi:hypothetical protein